MKSSQFDRLARKLFGDVLSDFGFSCEKSKHCMFHRKTAEEVFHFVLPDRGTKGSWFDVKVFATSPRIDPRFPICFPDELGIPSDRYSFLNKWSGVGPQQQAFKCETPEEMQDTFEFEVKPLLLASAVPFLDKVASIVDLVPFIKRPFFLGLALKETGSSAKAKPILQAERDRLEAIFRSNPKAQDIKLLVDHLEFSLRDS